MFKRSLALLLMLALVISVVGCGNGGDKPSDSSTPSSSFLEAPTPEDPLVLKLSHTFLSDQPMHYALVEASENIEERTDGAIKIEVYENSQIPNGIDGAEQCMRGAKVINVYDIGCVGDWVPDYNAIIGPFLFDTQEEFSEFCQTDLVKELNDQAEEVGIKVISIDYAFGFRNIGTSKKVINTLEDMKGLKIRVPKSTIWVEAFKALGASPTTLGWSEIHNAIQNNVIEAMESSTSDIAGNQFWEILDHLFITKHFLGTSAVMLSAEVFDSLTPEQQEIVEEEFKKGAIRNNELSDIAEAEAEQLMKDNGVEIHEIDLTEFKEASKAYFDNMPGLSSDIYERIQKELEKIRNK